MTGCLKSACRALVVVPKPALKSQGLGSINNRRVAYKERGLVMGATLDRRDGAERRAGADRRVNDVMLESKFFDRRWRPERRLPDPEEAAFADSAWERYFAEIEKRSKATDSN